MLILKEHFGALHAFNPFSLDADLTPVSAVHPAQRCTALLSVVYVQDAVRLSLLYCLQCYRGDDNIKTFVWELIAPGGGNTVSKNHSGLSAPVPRGRKNKKGRKENRPEGTDWAADEKFDPELFLDKSYRKHLDR